MLALVLVLCSMSCTKQYDDESDFRVKLSNSGKSVEITEYIGEKQAILIPPRLQKMPVSDIGTSAFRRKEITDVTIPKSVTAIGISAFDGNQITSVAIPNSMAAIGGGAFTENQITSVTIGANVLLGRQVRKSYFPAFDNGFDSFYNSQGKKAGTYTLSNDSWQMQ